MVDLYEADVNLRYVYVFDVLNAWMKTSVLQWHKPWLWHEWNETHKHRQCEWKEKSWGRGMHWSIVHSVHCIFSSSGIRVFHQLNPSIHVLIIFYFSGLYNKDVLLARGHCQRFSDDRSVTFRPEHHCYWTFYTYFLFYAMQFECLDFCEVFYMLLHILLNFHQYTCGYMCTCGVSSCFVWWYCSEHNKISTTQDIRLTLLCCANFAVLWLVFRCIVLFSLCCGLYPLCCGDFDLLCTIGLSKYQKLKSVKFLHLRNFL